MQNQLEKVNHHYLRYANCWEDADLLRAGLQVRTGDRVLSIGSAGDNSFSLLVDDPELLVAVDVNAVQLKLIALKRAAFEVLDYEDFLRFLGFHPCSYRLRLLRCLRPVMSEEDFQYWHRQPERIERGILFSGKFERYFASFRRFVLPLIHGRERVDQLLTSKSESEQIDFFERHWNNHRWRGLFRVFFGKTMMGLLGRDPAFLREVRVPVGEFILGRAAAHLRSAACQWNYFLRFILTGNFGEQLPHYARAENFDPIRTRLSRLQLHEGLAESCFERFGQFDRFNLSNIFEYMSPPVFQRVSENLAANAAPSARFAYWNLMVPRRMSEVLPGLGELPAEGLPVDRGFFYRRFRVEGF